MDKDLLKIKGASVMNKDILIPWENAERVLELARQLVQRFKYCDIFNPAPLETDLTVEEDSSVKIPKGWKFVLTNRREV